MAKVEQFQGCILGLAVGDAVGAPVEKASISDTRKYIEERVKPKNFEGVVRSAFEELPFGHYTDDTQLARELMISLVDCEGKFDPVDYANRIRVMFEDDLMVGSGGTTRRAAKRLIDGWVWKESGDMKSAGNGSVMRVAPLALAFQPTLRRNLKGDLASGDLSKVADDLLWAADNQSIITHAHADSRASSIMLALFVYMALHIEEVKPISWCVWAAMRLEKHDEFQPFAYHVRELGRFVGLDKSREEVYRWVKSMQNKSNWEGISPYAKSSALWAIYSFLSSPDDYWQTIETALWPGGDVDTIAAMAGAVSGARNGLEGIPDAVVSNLNDKGKWTGDELSTLAERLYEAVHE